MIKEVDFDGYEGDPIIFYINPIFFAQILTKTTSIWLRQNEQEPPDKGVFTRDNFTHIIALGKEDWCMELTIYQRIILVTLSRMVWLLYKLVATDADPPLVTYLHKIAKDGKIKDSFEDIINRVG